MYVHITKYESAFQSEVAPYLKAVTQRCSAEVISYFQKSNVLFTRYGNDYACHL